MVIKKKLKSISVLVLGIGGGRSLVSQGGAGTYVRVLSTQEFTGVFFALWLARDCKNI